eukprot:Awhi_evm1s3427
MTRYDHLQFLESNLDTPPPQHSLEAKKIFEMYFFQANGGCTSPALNKNNFLTVNISISPNIHTLTASSEAMNELRARIENLFLAIGGTGSKL